METEMKEREVMKDQTNICGVSVELCCKRIRYNFRDTEQLLNELLEKSKGRQNIANNGPVMVNTDDEPRLAKAIVEEVTTWLEENGNMKPKLAAAVFGRVDRWLAEVEGRQIAQHDEQAAAATDQPGDNMEAGYICTEDLKVLFIPVFFDEGYKHRETATTALNLSRFSVFVERLNELIGAKKKCTKKRLGEVAYMIHKSKMAKMQYRKNLAKTCRVLFKCCRFDIPKDIRTRSYGSPDNELVDSFSDLLMNPNLKKEEKSAI